METPKDIPLRERVDAETRELSNSLPDDRDSEDEPLSGWALLSVITALMFGAFMLALDNTVLCMYFTISGPATNNACKPLLYLVLQATSGV